MASDNHLRPVQQTNAALLQEVTFLFFLEVCKLWVLFRESFVLFKRNASSSYFGKLLEANTVVVRNIIPLLQVLRGIL
jgi:hypothetical protein